MKVYADKNGISIAPETDFETDYLQDLFTLNQNRKVTFVPETGVLTIRAVAGEETK